MRRIRYSVVMSLDGYIAGPKGEADWISMDTEFDFAEMFGQFDTILVRRRTFDGMVSAGRVSMPGMKTVVFSTTLRQEDHPEVTIVTENQRETLAALKARPGKDIWLFGGGPLFRSLAEDGLVDTVEVGIVPVLLGAGIPLLPSTAQRIKLSLTAHRIYRTGIVSLEYAITPGPGREAGRRPLSPVRLLSGCRALHEGVI
ncbi:MAG TPA: dihydrofolate reductase family protein [Terriglobales bacterium]|nr:dihydrofolate reductase family protein [Terriglobales bacterium]